MTFRQKLDNIVKKNNSLLCIGLDSDIERIPSLVRDNPHPQSTFNKAIIDATHDLVCAYKPNTAFYESRGVAGIEALKITCDYLGEKYPEIPIILDAKRGDIGNTNEQYAKFAFDFLQTDAITLHPFLGIQTLDPFLKRRDKGIIFLCKTSNPGSGEIQNLEINGKFIYQIVAENVVEKWNYNGNCCVFVGATYPTELNIVRRIAEDLPILTAGIGAQGGDVEKTVRAGVDKAGRNLMINSSRNIIFASAGSDFAQKAREEALKLKTEINKFR